MMRHVLKVPTLTLVALLVAALAVLFAARAEDGRERVPLTVETADGARHVFQVEVADEPEERRVGLMHREEMARDEGMLFAFSRTEIIRMWMQNTILPLDMIFANREGRIVHIHENAVPFSTAEINSRRRALYVLEVNAGVAEALGLAPGDRLVGAGIAE
ncbi:MAG: DUF192 domain-containing protein [Alphaproteobacteria bacterium]|nr:DUF192 domain-containing protein [Alphaproteobacteria bacterium]